MSSFKEHLREDGHNKWPKRVGDRAGYNTINLRQSFFFIH